MVISILLKIRTVKFLNTANFQRSLTVYFDQIFILQHVKSVYLKSVIKL